MLGNDSVWVAQSETVCCSVQQIRCLFNNSFLTPTTLCPRTCSGITRFRFSRFWSLPFLTSYPRPFLRSCVLSHRPRYYWIPLEICSLRFWSPPLDFSPSRLAEGIIWIAQFLIVIVSFLYSFTSSHYWNLSGARCSFRSGSCLVFLVSGLIASGYYYWILFRAHCFVRFWSLPFCLCFPFLSSLKNCVWTH